MELAKTNSDKGDFALVFILAQLKPGTERSIPKSFFEDFPNCYKCLGKYDLLVMAETTDYKENVLSKVTSALGPDILRTNQVFLSQLDEALSPSLDDVCFSEPLLAVSFCKLDYGLLAEKGVELTRQLRQFFLTRGCGQNCFSSSHAIY